MAVIDSKKLLPAGQPGSSIVKSQTPFLVPTKNITFKKSAVISSNLLKPAEEKETAKKQGGKEIFEIKKKVISIKDVLKNTFFIRKKREENERKERERIKAETREKLLEKKKPGKKPEKDIPSLSIPGGSIFDSISRFIGFTLAGYLFNKYYEFLPKLIEFGKIIGPVTGYILEFGKNILNGIVDFIDFGYKTYDTVRDSIKKIGGENAQKTFDDFSKNLNLVLNGAIIAATVALSTVPKTPRGRLGKISDAKPSTLSKNAKLTSYLKRDPQTKLIEKRYGNDAARMYEARKFQGASANRARADVLKRFKPLTERYGVQRGLAGGTGKGSIFSRGLGKAANRASLKVLGTAGTKIAKGIFGRVPIIGGLLDFAFSLAMGEKPGRAAAKAVGSTIGAALGTFIPIPFAGTIIGGILGDIVGGALYDTFATKEKPTAKAEGGRVSSGQSTVAPTRRLKVVEKKRAKAIQPQKTQPGRDVGGKKKIEELYGVDEPGQRSALRALKDSSADVKRMKVLGGLPGAMFGAGIDLALGQKPDKKLSRDLGNIFGSVIQSAVDAEVNSSFLDVTRGLGMANGGVVPSREIKSNMSLGEKVGKRIATALAISIEGAASSVLNNLNRELRLEGSAPGSGTQPSDGLYGGGQVPPELLQAGIPENMAGYLSRLAYLETRIRNIPNAEGSPGMGYFQAFPAFTQEAIRASGGLSPRDANFATASKATMAWIKTYNPDAFAAIMAGKFNRADNLLKGTWPSLPGGSQAQPANIQKESLRYLPSAITYVAPDRNVPLTITSRRGMRGGKFHAGTDIATTEGVPLRAISDGVIVDSGVDPGGWGNFVVFKDNKGIYHLYGHVQNGYRRSGNVKQGDIIARVGTTGAITGPHLHWEAGTGWTGGIISGGFDPLDRYSQNAPFFTAKKTTRTPVAAAAPSASLEPVAGTKFKFRGTTVFKGKDGKYYELVPGRSPTEIDKRFYDIVKNEGNRASIAPSQSREIASLQHHPSYSQGGMMIIHDVNNIVMPILTG